MQQLMPSEIYAVEYGNKHLGQAIKFRYKMRWQKRHVQKVYIGEPFEVEKEIVLIGALSPQGLDDYKDLRSISTDKYRARFHSGHVCDVRFGPEVRVQCSCSDELCAQSLAAVYITIAALETAPTWCEADTWQEHRENCADYLGHRRSLSRMLAVISTGEELLSNAPFLQLSCGAAG